MASRVPSSADSLATPGQVNGKYLGNKTVQVPERQGKQGAAGVAVVAGGGVRAPGFDGAVGATRECLLHSLALPIFVYRWRLFV